MVSAGGFVATPLAAAYSASRFGPRGFSAALRGEVSKHPDIHVCDVCPTLVNTLGVDHACNYTGARLNLPPGALSPETGAKAVVRLATRPRNLTAVGAPAIAFKLSEFAAPNLPAAVMSGFLYSWAKRPPSAAIPTGRVRGRRARRPLWRPTRFRPEAQGGGRGRRRRGGRAGGDGRMARATPPVKPDGRYTVVCGRLWRSATPALGGDERREPVDRPMDARRAVERALRSGDAAGLTEARSQVGAAKVRLGERGPVRWSDGSPDLGRRMARTTPYAGWLAALGART